MSRRASQAGECWLALILCAGISPFCPLHPCCCALLCGSEASPTPPSPCLCQQRGFLVCGNVSSFTAPSQWCRSHPSSFVSVFSFFFLINLFIYVFIYFWLHWVFVAAHGLPLVAASGGYSLLWCKGFSLLWLLLLRSMGSRCAGFSSCGTWALERRLSSCGARALERRLSSCGARA